jgi:hypothetical protein
MGRKGRATAPLVEGHIHFCPDCGHDLLGLSGDCCPRCGRRSQMTLRPRTDGTSGRWLVVAVLACGVILALVGVKYRNLSPPPTFPARGNTTMPATDPSP